jgi:hypothetical protein
MELVFEASPTIPACSAALFRRHFGSEAPAIGHHVSAIVRSDSLPIGTLCYIHFSEHGTALLGGGACVDRALLRRLSLELRIRTREDGGAYGMTLKWALRHFQCSADAVFGYCGDRLAERIDLACGFQRTPHKHLLVYWCRSENVGDRSALVEKVAAIGPF